MIRIEELISKREIPHDDFDPILIFNGLHSYGATNDLCEEIPYDNKNPDDVLRIIVAGWEGDEHRLPHCHVIKGYLETPSFHCCIRLDTNKYYRNNHGVEDTLSDEDLKIFNEILLSAKNCPSQYNVDFAKGNGQLFTEFENGVATRQINIINKDMYISSSLNDWIGFSPIFSSAMEHMSILLSMCRTFYNFVIETAGPVVDTFFKAVESAALIIITSPMFIRVLTLLKYPAFDMSAILSWAP